MHTSKIAIAFSLVAAAATAGTVTVKPTGRYMAVPVENGAPKVRLEVFDGATRVAYDDVEWARGMTNWTGSLDLRGLAGRALEFRFSGNDAPGISAADLKFADAPFPAPQGQYDEPWRPQFHFTPPLGWNNDPNGLSYRDGEWHMFYQHNPFGVRWGNMHWGHAVSKDLVRWNDLGDVIAPDDHGPMFSGSAVVDHGNTSGFGKGAHVLIYTAAGRPHTQRVAWSLDGRNYAKWPKAAVEGRPDANRDPKVVWYAPGRHWVMAVYGEVEKGRHGVSLFTSKNLKDWTLASNVPGDLFDEGKFLYECPDFFELPIKGETGTRWVLTAANRQYAIGMFDGRTFVPETTRLEQTRPVGGLNPVYAWQSFSDAPGGRRIQIAWSHFDSLAGGRTDATSNQGMTLPMELSLVRTADGLRLARFPVKELEALSGEKVTDLHKHFIDKIVIKKDGKTYHRTPEVLDCWFESGSMPYAQQHYMGEGDASAFFPADFIAEGLDQTRGWFYTLMVLGTCLFDKSPYRNVIVNGLVLAEDGKKMSKRLKNYPDPTKMLDTYGADAIRLYMIYSPVVRAENLKFSENGVKQLMRDLLIPWWNAYSFFVTYANVDGFNDKEVVYPESDNVLDKWIVSSMETLIADVTAAMDAYDLQRSVRPFVKFIEDLTNWYIRRSRRRFWKSQNDGDKLCAYRTLRYVLVQLAKVAAPFTPFIAEEIYRNLKGEGDPESVHLCDFPTANAAARDLDLERRMADVQAVVELGRRLRADNDLKVRQPLSVLKVAGGDVKGLESLIEDELNVKTVQFVADETELCDVSYKANFKTLGKKCGPKMKAVAAAIAGAAPGIAGLVGQGSGAQPPVVVIEGIEIAPEDVLVNRQPKAGLVVASEGPVVVGLETALTPELVAEGLAREFVSQVQAMRKEADFEVTQRIRVTVEADDELKAAIEAHRAYATAETLAVALDFAACGDAPSVDLNGHAAKIRVEKAEG